ncbi:MAG: site-specific integrase, partial [Pseudonocardia sp.]
MAYVRSLGNCLRAGHSARFGESTVVEVGFRSCRYHLDEQGGL